jgi:aryl-alcohol dehydrogenase-like predicted oxidoreductase
MEPTPEKECAAIINTAIDAGINVINTGDTYAMGEVERVIGDTLKANKTRNSVVLMTKCDHAPHTVGLTLDEYIPEIGPNQNGPSRLNLIKACEASLRRLQTEWIDIYLIHRQDMAVHTDETLSALTDLVRSCTSELFDHDIFVPRFGGRAAMDLEADYACGRN